MGKKIWNEEQGRMVDVGSEKGESVKVSINGTLAKDLKRFAVEDGFDFSGVSFVTEKDTEGKTKTGKDGKPVFVLENGKPKKITVPESVAKVNSAVSQYVNVAVKRLIADRKPTE